MLYFTYFMMLLHAFVGVILIGIILLQRGRGGGLAGAFGGMGGQSAFGTKAGDVFTKITIYLATAWIVLGCVCVLLASSSKVKNEAEAGKFEEGAKAGVKSAEEAKDDDKPEKAGKKEDDKPAAGKMNGEDDLPAPAPANPPDAKNEVKPDPKPEAKTEVKPDEKTNGKADSKSDDKTKENGGEAKPDVKPATKESGPAEKPEPAKEPEPAKKEDPDPAKDSVEKKPE